MENQSWYAKDSGGGHQGLIIDETTGETIAVSYRPENANLLAASLDLFNAATCALADMEGVMPQFEPSGDRTHSGWKTIQELQNAIAKAKGLS
jgi:hypothetical protein